MEVLESSSALGNAGDPVELVDISLELSGLWLLCKRLVNCLMTTLIVLTTNEYRNIIVKYLCWSVILEFGMFNWSFRNLGRSRPWVGEPAVVK